MSHAPIPVLCSPGRRLVVVGWLIAIGGIAAYVIQVWLKHFRTPWYLPPIVTIGFLCVVAALGRQRNWKRYLSLAALGLLAAFSWMFIIMGRLPEYTGPVAAGKPFPQFTTLKFDGTPFTQRDLVGDQDTVMVFFRGRW